MPRSPGRARSSRRSRCSRYVDWQFLFHAWELKGKFPAILEQPAAREVFDNAQELLAEIVPTACSRPAASTASGRARRGRRHRARGRRPFSVPPPADRLRRQPPNRCLADYVAPAGDHLGAFAVSIHGADEVAAGFEAEQDDYRAIMAKALADRLAEAFAEYLHERARFDGATRTSRTRARI